MKLRSQFLSDIAYPIVEDIRNIIENNGSNISATELQCLIEELCIKNETEFFNNAIANLKNKVEFNELTLGIENKWELNLDKAIDKLLHNYIINNCNKLLKEPF